MEGFFSMSFEFQVFQLKTQKLNFETRKSDLKTWKSKTSTQN